MSRIAVLPSDVADQIAAGEVVERPASVVKELVENALDAGAANIEIHVEEGGRKLIRVSDDGSGMSREEAQLALERHATSKIRQAHDLVGVRSFGFRGEALPAISSVSDFSLSTALNDGEGVEITAAGGSAHNVRDLVRRRGTTVSVRTLFHNIPARFKFMRGARSEWRVIQEAVIAVAITNLDVHLALFHDGRNVLSLPRAATLRDRLAGIWGADFASRLLDVEDVAGTTHTSGLVQRPSDVGTATRRVQLVVNGRAVRDPGLLRAAEAAYRSTIVAGLRPTIFLRIVVPGSDLDVNVHPAKAEIRLVDRWPVERAVEVAVRRALGTLESGALFGRRTAFDFRSAASPDAAATDSTSETSQTLMFTSGSGLHRHGHEGPADGELALDARVENVPESDQPPISIPPLVQLRRTYMMFERPEGIVLIDQHSAHERVLFERFMGALQRGEAAGQRLLFPLTLHLGAAEEEAFVANREPLEKLGFEVEGFGGHTLIVRAVPVPHPRFNAERCLRDTIAALAGDRSSSAAPLHQRLAATVACKAAIKAGELMSQDEMRALYSDLARTSLPAHDVHGRAVVVLLTWDEVERRFGRQ